MDRHIEKTILRLIPVSVMVLCIICIIMGSRISFLESRIAGREAFEQLGNRDSRLVRISEYDYIPEDTSVAHADEAYASAGVIEDNVSDGSESGTAAKSFGYDSEDGSGVVYASDSEWDGIHRVYLTFDDGPSIYTDDILDVLKDYGVKATFFVVGKENTAAYSRYLRILGEGHTLGMHSYSHDYSELYASPEAFAEDTDRIRTLLEDVTGETPVFYRFPGGSSNSVSDTDIRTLAEYLDSQGIVYFDWNASSGDASGASLSVDDIVANCLDGIESRETSVILLHDASNKWSTVQALPHIIEGIQAMDDTEILPITEDTTVIQHVVLNK